MRAGDRLSHDRARRPGSRRGIVAAAFLLALGALALPLVLRSRPERAAGGSPEAIDPFGVVSHASLIFRWTVPADGVPVRVELYDAMRTPLWSSEPSVEGSLRPPASVVDRWPSADLLWRPVAVPPGSSERPGDLAAFTLLP